MAEVSMAPEQFPVVGRVTRALRRISFPRRANPSPAAEPARQQIEHPDAKAQRLDRFLAENNSKLTPEQSIKLGRELASTEDSLAHDDVRSEAILEEERNGGQIVHLSGQDFKKP